MEPVATPVLAAPSKSPLLSSKNHPEISTFAVGLFASPITKSSTQSSDPDPPFEASLTINPADVEASINFTGPVSVLEVHPF